MRDLIAHGGAPFVGSANHGAGQGVVGIGRIGRLVSPNDAAGGNLVAGTVDAAFVDGVADGDVAISVAVRGHVARRGESCVQAGLHVLHGDEHVVFGGAVGLARIEHVRVAVDQSGQHRRAAEVDHLRAGGNFDLRLRSDRGDALAEEKHHLIGQHLAGLAVKHVAGANGDFARGRRAQLDASVGTDAWRRTCSSPRSRGSLTLSPERGRAE